MAATKTTAERVPDGWRLTGDKTWISNGGIADVYVVFARTGEAPGATGLSAFLMPADVAGLSVTERQEVIAPHPLASLRLDGVVLPESALIGKPGEGFKLAMSVLDVFRSTVGAAALGHGAPRVGRGDGAGEDAGDPGRRAGRDCRWCRAISPTWR